MSVYRTSSGTWGVDYRDEFGNRHRQPIGTEEAAAQVDRIKKLELQQAKARRDAITENSTVRVRDAIDIYLSSKPARQSTLRSQRGQFEALNNMIGETLLIKVTPQMLAAYLGLRAQQLSPSTLALEKRMIRHLFKVMEGFGMTAASPAAAIQNTTSHFTRARALTRDEELTVLTHARPSKLPRFLLGLDAGAHTAELKLLRPAHVDLERGLLHMPASKTLWRQRTLPMTGRLHTVMAELVATTPDPEANLFPRSRPTNFLAGFKAHIGIEFRFHDLRHTFAHRLTQAGTPDQIIARALGHAPRSTTGTYTHRHITPDDIRPYIEKLERLAEDHAGEKLTQEEIPCQERDSDSK